MSPLDFTIHICKRFSDKPFSFLLALCKYGGLAREKIDGIGTGGQVYFSRRALQMSIVHAGIPQQEPSRAGHDGTRLLFAGLETAPFTQQKRKAHTCRAMPE